MDPVPLADMARFDASKALPILEVTEEDIERFLSVLERAALPEHQVAILYGKFVDGLTMAEITEENGFTSVETVYRLYRDACEKIKQRAYNGREKA